MSYTEEMMDIFLKENSIRTIAILKLLKYLVKNNIPKSVLLNSEKNRCDHLFTKCTCKKRVCLFPAELVNRVCDHEFSPDKKIVELNSDQRSVLGEINSSLDENVFTTFLLFGVTGSGKTQVYIEVNSACNRAG